MGHRELMELVAALRANNVSKFTYRELTVMFSDTPSFVQVAPGQPVTFGTMPNAPIPTPSAPIGNQAATERIQELIDTLKLKDDELVNKIFPEGA
jgi:hypothetical protein